MLCARGGVSLALCRRCATVRRRVPCIEKPMSRWVVIIMGKYVIVVESGSDVTPELCERYGIVRVPMHVTVGDETVEDGSIDPLEIYSRCNELGVMPKTSGCAPADFAHVYDRIHAEQPDATILHLAYSEVTTCSRWRAQTWCKSVLRSVAASPDITPS